MAASYYQYKLISCILRCISENLLKVEYLPILLWFLSADIYVFEAHGLVGNIISKNSCIHGEHSAFSHSFRVPATKERGWSRWNDLSCSWRRCSDSQDLWKLVASEEDLEERRGQSEKSEELRCLVDQNSGQTEQELAVQLLYSFITKRWGLQKEQEINLYIANICSSVRCQEIRSRCPFAPQVSPRMCRCGTRGISTRRRPKCTSWPAASNWCLY